MSCSVGGPTCTPPSGGWHPRPRAKASRRRSSIPRITLSGMLGLLAGRGNLFASSDARAWAVTPALQWSAFDLGSARARLRGARAATREALADYEKTMLLALEETENALVTYRQRQERLVKLTDEVRESARAANIARARYREGVADFLSLLDAERTQLQAEAAPRKRKPKCSRRWSACIARWEDAVGTYAFGLRAWRNGKGLRDTWLRAMGWGWRGEKRGRGSAVGLWASPVPGAHGRAMSAARCACVHAEPGCSGGQK